MTKPINRSKLATACLNAFGSDIDDEQMVSLVIIKLGEMGLRLGQIYWVGKVGTGEDKNLQLNATVYDNTNVVKRTVRFSKTLEVLIDKTEPAGQDLGFGQNLSPSGDRNAARRQMGDLRS